MNKNVGIILNMDKEGVLDCAAEACSLLVELGFVPFLKCEVANLISMPQFAKEEDEIFTETSFVVVLGGDGTMLRVATKAALFGVPLLGVNFGQLGYLTDVERVGMKEALKKACSDKFKTERRMMLTLTRENDAKNAKNLALNEVVLSKGALTKMIQVKLKINGEYIDTYRTDGIIFSSPTGSTAYNLSAGGPILKPSDEMVAITFICPHMMHSRPFVVSADDIIEAQVVGNKSEDAVIVLDGHTTLKLNNNETIKIKASKKYYTNTIHTMGFGFYDILRKKMVLNRMN